LSTTIVDKPKAETMPVAVPKNEKRPERATVQIQAAPKGVKTAAAEVVDSYPSCLDLAADFLARG
jgi:hypothetical protein